MVICIKSYAPAIISWQPADRNIVTHQSQLFSPRVGPFTHDHSDWKAAKHCCCWKARSHHPGLHLCFLSRVISGLKITKTAISLYKYRLPFGWVFHTLGVVLHCAPFLAQGTYQSRAQLYSICCDKCSNPWRQCSWLNHCFIAINQKMRQYLFV